MLSPTSMGVTKTVLTVQIDRGVEINSQASMGSVISPL